MSHIHVGRDGTQFGPYSEALARSLYAQGTITADDLVWREGFESWRPASAVFGWTEVGNEAKFFGVPAAKSTLSTATPQPTIEHAVPSKQKHVSKWKYVGAVLFLIAITNTIYKYKNPSAEVSVRQAKPTVAPKVLSAEEEFENLWASAYQRAYLQGVDTNQQCRFYSTITMEALIGLKKGYDTPPRGSLNAYMGNLETLIRRIENYQCP